MLGLGVLPPQQRPPKFRGRAVLEALEVVLRAAGGTDGEGEGSCGCTKAVGGRAVEASSRCCWHLVLHEDSWSRVKRPEHVSCQALRSSQTLLQLCLATKRFVKRQRSIKTSGSEFLVVRAV